MQTNKLIYIVIGLQIILLLLCTLCFVNMNHSKSMKQPHAMPGMHMMKDGSMMMDHGSHMMGDAPAMNADMHSMMMDMTARMEGKTGDELDKIFLEDMIVHHQGAVDMAVLLQKGTQRPELQKMATDIVDVQTKEIDMMKGWLNEWFN